MIALAMAGAGARAMIVRAMAGGRRAMIAPAMAGEGALAMIARAMAGEGAAR